MNDIAGIAGIAGIAKSHVAFRGGLSVGAAGAELGLGATNADDRLCGGGALADDVVLLDRDMIGD